MKYHIEMSQRAVKDLKKLEKNIQENIIAGLERIRIRPYDFIKRVIGTKYYRLKVNKYRVIVDITNDKLNVMVITMGYRKNI